MIDYRYMTFIDLVETKNYTKTAERLNFTQPAVTKHIQFIESAMKVKLFTYEDRKLIITSKGKFLYEHLKKLVVDAEDIVQTLQESVNLKIGVSKTIGEYFVIKKVQQYNKKFPNSEVSLLVDNTDSLLNLLRNRQINLALISGPLPVNTYDVTSFMQEEMVLICSQKHPLSNRKVTLKEVLSNRLFIREKGAGVLEAIELCLQDKNLTLKDFQQTKTIGSISLIKSLVQQNEGISFIYKMSVLEELESGQLQQIFLTDFKPSQKFYSVKNPLEQLNEATEYFLEMF